MSVVDSPLARVASLTKSKVFMTSKREYFPILFQTTAKNSTRPLTFSALFLDKIFD